MNGDAGLIRVEPAHLDPAPDLDAELRRALAEDPLHLDLRDEFPAQLGDPLDQVVPPLDGVQGAGVHAAVLVHAEVGAVRAQLLGRDREVD